MKQLLREPVLHFAVLGALLFAGQLTWGEQFYQWLNPESIHITAQDIDRLQTQWRTETGNQPTEAELDALIKQAVDEELLFREALRLKLQYGDPVIHTRLIRNIRFIDPETSANDNELLEQAYRMGMLYSDLVVRRRLIQKLRHRIENSSAVTEEEVREHFEENRDLYRQPTRFSFTQLFFSTADAAQKAKQQLSHQNNIENLGEPFLLGKQHRNLSTKEIEQRFGQDIAYWVENAATGVWSNPLNSVYGTHLLHIDEILESRPATYDEVKSRVVASLYAQQDYAAIKSELDNMRSRYEIVIDNRNGVAQ